MSYFMSPQNHLGLLPSGQGETAARGSSLGSHSPVEPVVVASGGRGQLNQKAEQVVPAAQAWGPTLAVPEARGCPGGPSWETLRQEEYGQYCHKFPQVKQPDICILTLAMMIAGIPTVPVPGLQEEDLIRAAQAFMMAHPEPEGAVEGVHWGQAHARAASGQMPLVRSRRGQPPGSCL
uniref:Spermatogenesis associated 25 n=1 Tax=Molossus molossus TaxID=27622 RepID=A0A7J8HKQ7_MOLMO|nr:spermatogenesis associated 25 [Molossus molossus]